MKAAWSIFFIIHCRKQAPGSENWIRSCYLQEIWTLAKKKNLKAYSLKTPPLTIMFHFLLVSGDLKNVAWASIYIADICIALYLAKPCWRVYLEPARLADCPASLECDLHSFKGLCVMVLPIPNRVCWLQSAFQVQPLVWPSLRGLK